MRLLLTHGYFLHEDEKERQIMRPYVPLGILYLSSYLRSKGFEVDVYDSTFGSRRELFELLETEPPGALGVYGNLMTRTSVVEIATRAKAAGWRVILGGPEPANYPDEYLDAGGDVIVAGEGELALEQLLTARMDPRLWHSIDGICFRSSSREVTRTAPARLISDLDRQPWPDRERVAIHQYLDTWRMHHGAGSLSVITARGCPYRCNWCSHSVFGMTHRRRSPGNVVDEVEWLIHRYSPDMLWMADDVFTIHHGWILSYLAEMKRRGLRIPFECITRADRLNERIAAALAELGCMRVWIGSESGSQRILDAMERGVTVKQIQNAVALCKQNGIQTGMFLMWGYEGEGVDDIEATVEHVKHCRPDVFFTTVAYPIRGTPYFDKVEKRLVNIRPWRETTEREPKVRGRHSRNFYRHADELLRSATTSNPDPLTVLKAREGLCATYSEVEA